MREISIGDKAIFAAALKAKIVEEDRTFLVISCKTDVLSPPSQQGVVQLAIQDMDISVLGVPVSIDTTSISLAIMGAAHGCLTAEDDDESEEEGS